MAEGTSLLTRQGSNTLMSSNLIVSATQNIRTLNTGLFILGLLRDGEIRRTEPTRAQRVNRRVGVANTLYFVSNRYKIFSDS